MILIVGDSLSAGYGLAQDQSWPALLAKRLDERSLPFHVANASISGETTRGGLARFDDALLQFKPAVVLIALGANDGLRGLALDRMESNLREMVRKAQGRRARVLLVGMRLPPNYGPDYTARFEKVCADIARETKAALVPFMLAGFAEKRESFLADGIHPAAGAQPLVLDNIWPALLPLLK